MPDGCRVIVTMPAFNAERTLERTWRAIPKDCVDDVIVVDDGSSDATVAVARDLGLETIVHERNLGYGGNQKTCYDAALARGADVVILLHPDYQYDPRLIPSLTEPICNGDADFSFGSRFAKNTRAPIDGGMPFYRWAGNRFTTWVENTALGTDFTELHSGYKAYSRYFLENLDYHAYSDSFVFDSQMLIEAVLSRQFTIAEVPIPTRYDEDSSSASIPASLEYVFLTLCYATRSRFARTRRRLPETRAA
jgi:glycosyltransferase involved in cell wall biosynthesis